MCNIKNTSESDPRSYEATNKAIVKKACNKIIRFSLFFFNCFSCFITARIASTRILFPQCIYISSGRCCDLFGLNINHNWLPIKCSKQTQLVGKFEENI